MTADADLSKGDRTRRAILKASYRLFVKQGFAATSMRQIATRTDLALAGIYNHFASKEAIFSAILEEQHPFLEIIPVVATVRGDSVETFVRNAAHTLVDQLGHHPDFLNLMLIEIVEFKAHHVPLLFEEFLPAIMPLAQRIGGQDPRLRKLPSFVLARAFLGMFFSYFITEILLGEVMPHQGHGKAIDAFVDIFLHGILKEAA
jgi:AcrR family transcriptional regulator